MVNNVCRYCGKEKTWKERDYDMGLYLNSWENQMLGCPLRFNRYVEC